MIRISIIVPIYNVEKYLKRCLDSILMQSFDNYEAILVDDGSTDNSGMIADEYGSIDKRFVVIHQENGGLSDARNKALDMARGDYYLFLDSDDYFKEDALKKLINKIENEGSDLLVFGYETVDSEGKILNKWLPGYSEPTKLADKKELLLNINSCVWSKMYHKSLFDDLRFIKYAWYEDYGILPSILLKSKKISFFNESFVYYFCDREGNITTTFDNRINWIVDMSYHIIDELKYYEAFELYEVELKKLIEREVMNCMVMCFRYKCKQDFFSKFVKDSYILFNSICPNINSRKFPYRNYITARLYFIFRGVW